jgi:hypothetical protein
MCHLEETKVMESIHDVMENKCVKVLFAQTFWLE